MTEAEALKRFIPILGRISSPGERAIINRYILQRIAGTKTGAGIGVCHKQAGALAWPNDNAKAQAFEAALNDAADTGEFVSCTPRGFLYIEELASWPGCPAIAPDSPLVFWLGEPAPEQASPAPVAPSASDAPETEWHLMATAEQLCAAFGAFTGMNKNWFANPKDKPALKAARFQPGQGGRNKREPLFYVYPVLQWLVGKRRKTGNPMREATGWRLLKQHFPRVYEAYELSAPDPD